MEIRSGDKRKGKNIIVKTFEKGINNSKWGNPETLEDHFKNHGSDFGAKNKFDYAKQANDFYKNKNQFDVKIDAKGVTRVYDSKTNTFGSYNKNGATKTFYKPDPKVHGSANNSDYWKSQPGN